MDQNYDAPVSDNPVMAKTTRADEPSRGQAAPKTVVIKEQGGKFEAQCSSGPKPSALQTFQDYYGLEQWLGQEFGVSPDAAEPATPPAATSEASSMPDAAE